DVQFFYSRCYEDLTLPYLPLVEALASLLQAARQVSTEAEADAAIIQRLLDRGTAFAPATRDPPMQQAHQDKLRLFLAVSRTIVTLARHGCMVFAVDDLHWADRSSIDLFVHLSFAVADASLRDPVPLMLVGSHRPTSAADPLFRMLARLRREE